MGTESGSYLRGPLHRRVASQRRAKHYGGTMSGQSLPRVLARLETTRPTLNGGSGLIPRIGTRNQLVRGRSSFWTDLAGVDLEVFGRGVGGLDGHLVARARGDEAPLDRLLPDDDLLHARRDVLDLVVPLVVGDGEVGVV